MVDVLGRDDPNQPVKINFTIREYMGIEVFKYNAEDHPNGIAKDKLVPITSKDGLGVGDVILVPALMGGYYLMKVEKDDNGTLSAQGDKLIAVLEFGKDDRGAWICGGLINTRGLLKLEITT